MTYNWKKRLKLSRIFQTTSELIELVGWHLDCGPEILAQLTKNIFHHAHVHKYIQFN